MFRTFLACLEDPIPDPIQNVEIDDCMTDPELFMKLYCKEPGIGELGDLWLDVP